MNSRSRILIFTLLMVFVVGVWLSSSQAQRSSQKSAPSRAAKSSRNLPTPAARPRQKDGATPALRPMTARAVEFAESVPVRNLAPAERSISNAQFGPPEVEGKR